MAGANENVTELEKQFCCITVCSFCQRTFTNPKILPCFHTFCLYCLDESTTHNLQSGVTPKCPMCSIDVLIPKQGVAALPTNEYVNRIIATADALSSTLDIASFERTEGYDPSAADRSHLTYRRHDYGGSRPMSTTEIGQSIKRRAKTGRVCPEESQQVYASDKMQRMRYCQKHMLKFDQYCSNCTRVICQLCTKTEHRSHPVISVALAVNDLRLMIDSYLHGVASCLAYYRAQNNLRGTAREGRTATANVNQMHSTRARPDKRGNVKAGRQTPLPSGSTSMDLVKRRKACTCLDSWNEYVKLFNEKITIRGCILSDICKIAKELHKLHETWRHSYEQESLVQQTQNSNALCAKNDASIGDLDNRRELEEKEQRTRKLLREQKEWMANEKRLKDIIKRQSEEKIRMDANLKEQEQHIQKLLWEQKEWMANAKRFKDIIKRQSEVKIRMEANLKEQERKYAKLKMETDRLDRELRILQAKSKPNFTDKLFRKKISPTREVSPNKQTLNGDSTIHELHFVKEQQKLLDQKRDMEEYYTKEKVIWGEREKQLIREIRRLESQTNVIHKQHDKSKSQLLEHLKEKFEWTQEKELCSDSLKQSKLGQEKLEAALKAQQESNAEIQKRLTQQLQNEERQNRELEQLISWIERTDTQPGEFQTTTGSGLDNCITKKLKVSIIKKTRELSENERLLLHRNEDLSHQMEELKSRASIDQMTQQRKSSNVAVNEHEWAVKEKQFAAIIKKLEVQVTAQQQDEKRLDRELEKLISWIERIDRLVELHMTTERDSENSIIEKLRVSIVKKAKELSENERLLLDKNEDLCHQVEELKSRASSELMALQLKSSSVAKKGQLEATLRRESHLTAELTDLKHRLGLADKNQEDDTGLLRELKNLIKWIERGDTQPTEYQMTTEGESANSIIKKIKDWIIETTTDLKNKEKQLLQTIEELGQQITVLQQRLATEEANQRKLDKELVSERDKLAENVQLLKDDKKQLNAKVQELESEIHDEQDALTQQKECTNNVKEQLKAALIKNEDYTSLKQRLEHSVTYKNELSLIQVELEHLIQWIDSVDKQSADKKTIGEELQNHAVQKLKFSIKKKTNELKATEKLLSNRISVLEHQVTELQQNLASEQQTCQTALRNSDENLHKQLRKKDRILEAQVKQHHDEIHDLQNEIRMLREELRQQEGQYLADKKQEDETTLLRELQNLINWMEREDGQPAEDQMMMEGKSENSIIWKIKASIIKTTKELRDKEIKLSQTIEESGQQINELRQTSINEENNHRKLGKEFSSERDKLMQNIQLLKNGEKQLNARVQELESHIQDLQDALTQQKECNNNVEEQLKAALKKHGDETSLKQRLEHELSHQLESSVVAEKERASLIREKQDADKIKELEHQIDRLKENLTQQHQSNKTTQGQLEATLRMESHLTAEMTDLRHRLRLAEKKQEDDIGLLRDLENLIKWIERGDTQPTEDQMMTEGESENKIIKKIKDMIIKTTEELKNKQLLQTIEESNQQIAELRKRLATEGASHRKLHKESANERDKLMQNIQLLKTGEKQINARVQELESQIHDLLDALTQQKECNSIVKEQLRAALIKHGDETSLKQRLEHELSLTQLELEHVIQWIDTVDKQSTEKKTIGEELQNGAIQKLKVSVKKKTNELKATEKQLLKRINILEHQVAELQQSLTSEQQMHQASLRNSDANLHKQLREKDTIHEDRVKQLKEQIHYLRHEVLQLRVILRQQEEQNKSSIKELAQVATGKVMLVTDMKDLKQKHLNTKNTFDDSTAAQAAASRKPTLPTGISNVGNTCYFGATMQNLVYTFLLTDELHPSKQSPTDVEQLLTNAYIECISKYYEANCDQTFRHMYKVFCKKSSRFADRGQHDSHDLFVNFLNCLRDEERRSLGSANSPGFRNVLTAVDKVFGGHTITVYVCSTCKTPYHVCEPFLDISVPILGPTDGGEDEEEDLFINHLHNPQSIGGHDPVRQAVETTMRPLGIRSRLKTPQRIFQKRSLMSESLGEISLKQCLVYYSRTERIHNEYLCNPCEAAGRPAMTSALKRTLIYNPPAVLVLHLKRFEQTTVGFKKCNQRVTYDEYLDIGPYCSSSCLRMREPDDANVWYSLYGVVIHRGSLTSGHYVSYIKVRDCDTRLAKQFMQQTFLNRDQVLNADEIIRINASRGMVRSRKEWEPKEVEGRWYLADDEYVKAVEKTEALSQEAYLLFYERVAK